MPENSRSALIEHRLFLLTIFAKGLLGAIQLATAAIIHAGVLDKLPKLVQSLVSVELSEDPNDFLAGRLMALAGKVAQSDQSFFALYFAAHGLLHVGVVAALLFGSAWAYPVAIAVLAVFVVYQMFEWFAVGGAMLLLLSALDLAVIYLTLLEWRRKRA